LLNELLAQAMFAGGAVLANILRQNRKSKKMITMNVCNTFGQRQCSMALTVLVLVPALKATAHAVNDLPGGPAVNHA
jgi:hypothetical protein